MDDERKTYWSREEIEAIANTLKVPPKNIIFTSLESLAPGLSRKQVEELIRACQLRMGRTMTDRIEEIRLRNVGRKMRLAAQEQWRNSFRSDRVVLHDYAGEDIDTLLSIIDELKAENEALAAPREG